MGWFNHHLDNPKCVFFQCEEMRRSNPLLHNHSLWRTPPASFTSREALRSTWDVGRMRQHMSSEFTIDVLQQNGLLGLIFKPFFLGHFLKCFRKFQQTLGMMHGTNSPWTGGGCPLDLGRPSSAVFSMSREIMSFGSTPPRRSLGMGMGWGGRRSRHICHPPKTAIDEFEFLTNKCFFFLNSTCLRK